MSELSSRIHLLDPGAVIELFELDLSRFAQQVIRFHAGTNAVGTDIVWRGHTYQRFPVKGSGFEIKSQGTLPRPKLAVANVTGIISSLCKQYSDLVGCRVTRYRTLARYLDAVNFPEGNPSVDPYEAFPDDIFSINQKSLETKEVVEFELAVAWDVEGIKLPRRQVIQNLCPWRYRGEGCGYAGHPVATENDILIPPHAMPAEKAADCCGKRLTSCKLRFPSGPLPFGGFPGVGQYR